MQDPNRNFVQVTRKAAVGPNYVRDVIALLYRAAARMDRMEPQRPGR
ncbi:MAG: hypothetical protein JO278_16585 [Dyella sp.]|nr:hypothetical protein [Dyella sp.]MBV8270778.1 hypothetical protein [Cupriavidus sp.]